MVKPQLSPADINTNTPRWEKNKTVSTRKRKKERKSKTVRKPINGMGGKVGLGIRGGPKFVLIVYAHNRFEGLKS